MQKWSAPVLLALLLAAPGPARAQAAPGLYAGALGGWTRCTGPTRDLAGDGWCALLVAGQFVDAGRRLALGSEIGHYDLGRRDDAKLRLHPVDVVFQAHLAPSAARLRPFVQGGLGVQYVRTETRTLRRYDYDLGVSLGAGAAYQTRGTLDLLVDAGYHWVFAGHSPLGRDLGFLALRGGVTVPLGR